MRCACTIERAEATNRKVCQTLGKERGYRRVDVSTRAALAGRSCDRVSEEVVENFGCVVAHSGSGSARVWRELGKEREGDLLSWRAVDRKGVRPN